LASPSTSGMESMAAIMRMTPSVERDVLIAAVGGILGERFLHVACGEGYRVRS